MKRNQFTLTWIFIILATIVMSIRTQAYADGFLSMFNVKKPIIGVINFDPLTDDEGFEGIALVRENAMRQVHSLEEAGVDAILFENGFGEGRLKATKNDIRDMTALVKEAVESTDLVVGIEFLLNDPKASLKIAKDSGAKFIRTDYFVDRMYREEWGDMEIDPKGLMKYRKEIGAEDIYILTDIQVKYATMKNPRKTITQSARHAKREKSDGVVVSGVETGSAPSPSKVRRAKRGAGSLEVVIGSGFSPKNAHKLFKYADAAIVGTSMMDDGVINEIKERRLMAVVKQIRKKLEE